MNWKAYQNQEAKHKKANTPEDSDPERKEDYITLALVALLVSVFITGLITPQLARSPFF